MTEEAVRSESKEDGASDVSAAGQVATVVENVRALVRAELAHLRSRFEYSRRVLQQALLFGAFAFLALMGAMIALATGLVLTLAPLIGPGLATLVVTAALIAAAAICGVKARNWAKKVSFPELEKYGEGDD